jgi:hypothetical protein
VTLDLHAIGTALADAFDDVTAPTGTMGGTVIKGSSVGVQTVASTPYIIVELPEGEVTSEMQADRRIEHDFPVYFLFGKSSGDVPRDTAVMLKWLGPLLGALEAANTLGIGSQSGWSVLKSRILSWTPGQYEVGGQPYHAWHFTVRVWTADNLSVTP